MVAQGVDMQTGDPHKTTLTHAVNVLVNLYDTLVSRDANLALRPGLALSWRSVDPTTWEFKLRQGVGLPRQSRMRDRNAPAESSRKHSELQPDEPTPR